MAKYGTEDGEYFIQLFFTFHHNHLRKILFCEMIVLISCYNQN